MATPVGNARRQATPGTGRQRSAVKTPKSVLTPNDDAAEKANMRRKRRSEALRLSLSDAFAGQADQAQQQHDGSSGARSSQNSRPLLSDEARSALLEQCLKLATENKITDRNAWHLDLITHLPDIVGSGPSRGALSSGFNFQKMSGGLDAGVTIYSKRVDLTYKQAFQSLRGCGPSKDDDEGDAGCEDDGDGIEDAAAAAAKAQKQRGGKRQQGESADEGLTLATPEQLRAKKGDSTFAVDPLFHTMSALFDEGGAKGLLLLNRSVYDGAHIMTSPHDVPEQQFSLQAPQQQDTLLDLRALQQPLAACSGRGSSAGQGLPVLTPGLQQLYDLLGKTTGALPSNKQEQQQQQQQLDVSSIMQQATRKLPPTPMPQLRSGGAPAADSRAGTAVLAAAPGAGVDAGASHSSGDTDGDVVMAASDGMAAASDSGDGVTAGTEAADGPYAGGMPVVASFLADCTAAEDEAVAAAADDGYSDCYDAGDDGSSPPGFEGDGDTAESGAAGGWGQEQQQEQRQLSMMGLAADQAPDDSSVLDVEALQQLLGAAAGSSRRKATSMVGSGWAGSRYWKYRSAAAAAARMAAGGGAAVKRASTAAQGSRARSAAFRIDFSNPPEDLSAALAAGSRHQTCLVTAPSSSTADTLLPEDLHYKAASLLQLSLRATPISFTRRLQQHGAGGAARPDAGGTGDWAEEGAGAGGGAWADEGYGDDGSDGYGDGADGYNAGDLSMGDPGFSVTARGRSSLGSGSGPDAEMWSTEGELLSAPARLVGQGVKYARSAQQVNVHVLKDLLWDSLVTVNQQHSSSSSTDDSASAAAAASDGGPVIPFQDVIVAVPQESAAGSLADVSVHMCFICLLHLANERGLVVKGHDDLTTLSISNVHAEAR